MRRGFRQSAFSLIEMVVVLATILILAGALLGVGKYLTIRASVDLTNSELEVLATALQQYYDDWDAFPFDTPDTNGNGILGDDYVVADLENDLDGTISSGTLPEHPIYNSVEVVSSAGSIVLFYFLDRNPNSRTIIEALTDSLISNRDASGQPIQLEQPSGSGTLIDLPRFIDVWGTSIRYEYLPDTAFPILTSAGPDEVFGTSDDIVN